LSNYLEVEHLSKRFGELTVLGDVSLAVAEGEVLALLGPSGSGKTTFLRLLAGFETADRGTLRAAGRAVERLPPARRGFGMVFQHYALFPHLTVAGNVAFGLETSGATRDEIAQRVAEVLALVDLAGYEPRRIEQLSGGQQQRVALARALAPHPRLLLLDEPLSNLDPDLRERTRRELLEAIRRVGITTVLVTHEQEEAFYLGDRVAILWRGRLQQVGSPEELYLDPANRFVAGFIGRSSALPGRVTGVAAGGRCRVRLEAPLEAPLDVRATPAPVWEAVLPPGAPEPAGGAAVDLVMRPESLRFLAGGETDPSGALAGRVAKRRYGGPLTYYRVEVDHGLEPGEGGGRLEVEVLAGAGDAAEGDRVRIAPAGPARAGAPPLRAFPAAAPADAPPSPREPA
jgi:ABC-type Fe3+/spermidine/putrescine transport system ATPase subunit